MLVRAETIQEIAQKILEKGYEFDDIGIRVQESDYGLSVGDEIEHLSSHWIDGEESDELTDGICAVDVTSAASRLLRFGAYSGSVVLVIGANSALCGEDDGEIILRKAYGEYPVILEIVHLEPND